MKAYSLDSRERVMAAYEQGQRSIAEVAEQFDVGATFVKKMLRQKRERGTVTPLAHGGGRQPLLTDKDHRLLRHKIIFTFCSTNFILCPTNVTLCTDLEHNYCRFAYNLKNPLTENQQLTVKIRAYSEKDLAHKVEKSCGFRAYHRIFRIIKTGPYLILGANLPVASSADG
jgi:hypothetical protein